MGHVPITFTDEPVYKRDLAVEGSDGALYRRELAAGTAKWLHDHSILSYACPCGCGMVNQIATLGPAHGWTWNGNAEKPTLTPSIQHTSACRWHGFLTDGVFVGA